MARLAVAAVVVIGLAVGVWWLWPRDDPAGPSTTVPAAAPTTTDTTSPRPTTSTEPESHVVETVEEAEDILRDLWLGWFEGIYHQDEDRIREVVAAEEQVDAAVSQFGRIEFDEAPHRSSVQLANTQILMADSECLGVWSHGDFSAFTAAVIEGVHVLRWIDSDWKLISFWAYQEDLWENDCYSQF